MKDLKEQIAYEESACAEMRMGNAEIPEGWSVEKQEGFVLGMKHAMTIIFS